MIETNSYAALLEKKLIEEFKQKFYDKLGYRPIIVTKVTITEQEIALLSLDDLVKCFDRHLPKNKNKKVLSLKSKVRKRQLADLRRIFCAIARSMGYTFMQIGRFLGKRDHSTIMHSVKSFKILFETDESFKTLYFTILNTIANTHGTSIMEHFDPTQHQSKSDLSTELPSIKNQALQDN